MPFWVAPPLLSHLLGLVADDDGAVRSDDVDWPAAAELVALVEDDARRLILGALLHRRVERLHVDDHAVDVARLGIRIQLGQVVRVVYEEPDLLVVLGEEVLLGVLQALCHSLADGDRWHHHDELAPAVQAVELEHRLGVDVGLAGACLHLDVQLAGSHAAEKLLRLGNLVASLHCAHVCQYVGARKRDGHVGIALGALVAEVDLTLRVLWLSAQIAQVDGGVLVGLPLED